jgi:hypothetical protein
MVLLWQLLALEQVRQRKHYQNHYCMNTGNVLESEGHDRSDINLPGNQLQLLQDAVDTATSECDN